MRVDTSISYQNILAHHHEQPGMARRAGDTKAAGYDVVEISEKARKLFNELMRIQNNVAHIKELARSYEPLIREIIGTAETSPEDRALRVMDLRKRYGHDIHDIDDITISHMVNELF